MNGDQIFVFLNIYLFAGKLEEEEEKKKHKKTPYSKPEFIITFYIFHLPLWNYDETIQLKNCYKNKTRMKIKENNKI